MHIVRVRKMDCIPKTQIITNISKEDFRVPSAQSQEPSGPSDSPPSFCSQSNIKSDKHHTQTNGKENDGRVEFHQIGRM